MLKRLTAFLLVMVLLISCFQISEAASYKRLKKGSRGTEVRKLQTELKKQGYYSGRIDGIYGNATLKAVKTFQRKNGLKEDGIAGPQTQQKLYAKTSGSTSAAVHNPSEQQQYGNRDASAPPDVISFLQSFA